MPRKGKAHKYLLFFKQVPGEEVCDENPPEDHYICKVCDSTHHYHNVPHHWLMHKKKGDI
jgi:hypothetical protein